MAWVATTSFETTDGSTSPTDGNDITATGDGGGWSANWSGSTSFDYDNSQAQSGTWSLINTMAAQADINIARTLTTPQSSGRFSCRLRVSQLTQDNFGIQLMSGGTRGQDFYAQNAASGNRKMTDNNGFTEATGSIAASTWYKLDIDFDCSTDTSTLYVDDVSIKTGSNFLTAISTIDTVTLRNPGSAGSGGYPYSFWLDNIADGTPAAGGATYRRLGLLGVGQ